MITSEEHYNVFSAWWSRHFSRIQMGAFMTVLLLLIVSGSIVAFTSYHAAKSTSINTNNDEERQVRHVRSYVDENSLPERIGSMNIYIRKSRHRDNQATAYKRFRFPIAKFNHRNLRMFYQKYIYFFSLLFFSTNLAFTRPFLSFTPRIPIFADRLTKQTIIFAPTGSIIEFM